MSKRKNTLQDLEEFLKLQASTLVPPQPVERPSIPGLKVSEQTTQVMVEQEFAVPKSQPIETADPLSELKTLASQNKIAFYDFIIQAAESLPNGTNDVLLINTALYLKHGEDWKKGIEEYWRKRKANKTGE